MAPLPFPFSRAAFAIETAIAEGRAEEAMHKLAHALRTGSDKATRLMAADWIEAIGLPPGGAKALRKGRASLPDDWLEISEMVRDLQSNGKTYAEAVHEAAVHFDYSKRHIEKCVAMWNEAERAARESE